MEGPVEDTHIDLHHIPFLKPPPIPIHHHHSQIGFSRVWDSMAADLIH